MKNLSISACLCIIILFYPASLQAQRLSSRTVLESFTRWFCGNFNNITHKGQVDTSDHALNMHHILLSSWKTGDSTVWIYEEINFVRHQEQIYRQLVWSLKTDSGGSITANQYLLKKGWLFTGAWKDADRLLQLSTEYLASSPFCELNYIKVDKFHFKGMTRKNGCPNHYKNAVSLSNVSNLTATQFDYWDRGWDDQGKLVWGNPKEGIYYIRTAITEDADQPFNEHKQVASKIFP